MNKEFRDVVLEIRMPAAFALFPASIDKEVREWHLLFFYREDVGCAGYLKSERSACPAWFFLFWHF